MLHQATRLRHQQKRQEQTSIITDNNNNVYSFWIDFFTDAIQSTAVSNDNDDELPAQIPVRLTLLFISSFDYELCRCSCLHC
jgi:hypothetical protein